MKYKYKATDGTEKLSCPARGAWVEINPPHPAIHYTGVVPRKGRVG